MIEYNKTIKICKGLICGYLCFCDKKHPLSDTSGRVYFHRHVASIKIGHWLKTEEHVHHIDGNKINNNPDNLMIVSRSEHAKIEHNLKGEFAEIAFCKNCGNKLPDARSISGLCRECFDKSVRHFDPTKEELEKLVWTIPTTKVALIYGVTDKAIDKRCKLLGINKPTRGYWAKLYSQQNNN